MPLFLEHSGAQGQLVPHVDSLMRSEEEEPRSRFFQASEAREVYVEAFKRLGPDSGMPYPQAGGYVQLRPVSTELLNPVSEVLGEGNHD